MSEKSDELHKHIKAAIRRILRDPMLPEEMKLSLFQSHPGIIETMVDTEVEKEAATPVASLNKSDFIRVKDL
jgi:hypothetical protein